MVKKMFNGLLQTAALRKKKTELIQINVGDKCNQACSHCHVGASPRGNNNLDFQTAKKILSKLIMVDINHIEFTGGTPELNPNFPFFIEELSPHGKRITVRTSLTVLAIPEYAHFIDLYKRKRVKIIASLPGLSEDITDRQRGKGVFQKSIIVLKKLNAAGYGTGELPLDLVYNPIGDHLPDEQACMEQGYKTLLKDRYDIHFNILITMANSPINRFKDSLMRDGKFQHYMNILRKNLNPCTLQHIMCRHLISVDYQGYVYDCDFNLALGIRIKEYEQKKFWEVDFHTFTPEIDLHSHCLACTVNKGSSCHGVLIKERGIAGQHNNTPCRTGT
jgi:radical SAM/Cys-rich protein